MDRLKIIIAAATPEDREEAARILDSERIHLVARVAADSGGLSKAGSAPAEALVLFTDCLDRRESEFLERLYMTRPGLLTMVMCEGADADLLARAMGCGVSRVLDLANDREDPVDALFSVCAREKNRQAAISTLTVGYESKVLAFFGTKGGVGKTTVAVNTAVALARLNKRVALIDLDLQFGDVGIFLDITKSDTIVDVVEENDYSYDALASFLYKHYSGVRALCAPSAPEYADLIKAEHVEKILNSLSGEFDYIILDMPPAFTDMSILALERSTEIFFLVNPDISSLRNAQVSFNVFSSLGITDKLRLIVNKDGYSSLRRKDIEEVLGQTALVLLPCDYKNCGQAVNRGVPLVVGYRRSRVAQELERFAANIAGGRLQATKKKKLFGKDR